MYKSGDRMNSKRKVMSLLIFVVVVTIVMLTSVISDITFKSRSRRIWQGTILQKTTENIRMNAIGLRQYLFPLRIQPVPKLNNTVLSLSSATMSGLAVQKLKERKKKMAARLETSWSGSKRGDRMSRNGNGLAFKDPLVIEEVVNAKLKRVPFLNWKLRRLWNGRALQKDYKRKAFIHESQYHYLQKSIQSGGLNISRLSEYSVADRMLPFEWDLYKQPPVKNVSSLGSEEHSTVTLLSHSGPFTVGDQIHVRVDIFDAEGRPKRHGGDEVRVWLRENSLNAGAGFEVSDLHNGSYLATGKLLWHGDPEIRVSLAYPKEIIRAVFYLRNVMKGLRLNAGGFRSKTASEATICSPFPFSGVYRYLCNLTSLNYGLSWYCGMPKNPALTCKHWSQIRDLDFPNPLPIYAEEKKWFDRLNLGHKHHLRMMNQSVITLKVKPSTTSVIDRSLPCSRRSPADTWNEKAPRGFILNDQWCPANCTLPIIDVNFVNQCLKGSTLLMVGDSNLRHMLEMMAFLGLCIPTQPLLGKRNWHKPQTCINHENSYVVKWRTHALPFHTNNDHWAKRTNQQAVGLTLDSIPSTGRYFVLLHMYLHFTTHHYSIYRDRIRSMRDAVARLLRRNAATKVVIRGPHVAYKGWDPALGGDLQAPLYMKILREEFQSLYDRDDAPANHLQWVYLGIPTNHPQWVYLGIPTNHPQRGSNRVLLPTLVDGLVSTLQFGDRAPENKVYLLDFWDFSIAAESRDFHPEGKVTQEMLRTFFGYICE